MELNENIVQLFFRVYVVITCSLLLSVSMNQRLTSQGGGNQELKRATIKGKNMLPIGSIFFPLRIAPIRICFLIP